MGCTSHHRRRNQGLKGRLNGSSELDSRAIVHDANIVFKNLAQCWRAIAGHAALEAIEAGELIRELWVQEEIAGGVFVLTCVVLVSTTIENVRTRGPLCYM